MGMLFLVQIFTQLQKKLFNSCCIFPVSEKAFANFLKIFCHIWTQKEKKKRKGWDIILHILDNVKLVLHS